MYDKIFVIGFNKTATSSIHKLFVKNKLSSQHNGDMWEVDSYQCFSDNGNLRNFKELDKKYENSIFILNTRKLDKWIISRFKHGKRQSENNNSRKNWAWPFTKELVFKWVNDREKHHLELLEHFKDKPHKMIIVTTEKNDFLQFISQQLNIEYFNFEARNVIELSEEHDDIVKYVNKTFKQMNYNKNDKENILLKNIDFVNQYLRLYKNNIL